MGDAAAPISPKTAKSAGLIGKSLRSKEIRLNQVPSPCRGARAQHLRCPAFRLYLEIGAIIVRFIARAERLLLMAVVLNSWNFASSSALRKELLREATR